MSLPSRRHSNNSLLEHAFSLPILMVTPLVGVILRDCLCNPSRVPTATAGNE